MSNSGRFAVLFAAASFVVLSQGALGQAAAGKTAAVTPPAAAAPATASGPAPGNAEAAKNKIAMCVGCHGIPGYRTAYPEVYHVPKIYGQQEAYIVKALQSYKTGERNHPTMRGIARGLTDADMADIAAYYGGAHNK
jgi:cytochrome c553